MKKVVFEDDTLMSIRSFPEAVRQRAAYEIERVQCDKEPENWKPVSSVGQGVRGICIQVQGQYHILYITKYDNKVHILHAFEKKTQKTRQADIDLAKCRLNNSEVESE